MSQRPVSVSERADLDPFIVATGDASPRDQRDLMERPFFSLAKAKRTTPIRYASGDVQVEVFAVPEHGMATIWDADVLIWAASQIVAARNHGLDTSPFLRFTPYQLLTATGRGTVRPLEHLDLHRSASPRPDRRALGLRRPGDGDIFRTYVEHVLVPTLAPGEVVMMDNLGSHKSQAIRGTPAVPAAIQPRPEPHRAGLLEAQTLDASRKRTDTRHTLAGRRNHP